AGCGICCSNDECSDHIDCTEDVCGPNGCTHTPKNSLCGAKQTCDPAAGCVECSSEADCDDGLSCTKDACNNKKCSHANSCGKLQFCTKDGCAECVGDSDCQPNVSSAAIGTPGCTVSRCESGKCQSKTETCDIGFCCPPYGCLPQCVQTQ
ncbi:MAG TPA: hypothetical protein VEQ59_18160, partial [Polyangiaceae bacterium]|nr:hypothetical protein [Polyangiaceae bacterium]